MHERDTLLKLNANSNSYSNSNKNENANSHKDIHSKTQSAASPIKSSLDDKESHSVDAVFDAMFEKEKAHKPMHPTIESTAQVAIIENSSSDSDDDNDDDNLISIINSMNEEKMPETPTAQASIQLHISRGASRTSSHPQNTTKQASLSLLASGSMIAVYDQMFNEEQQKVLPNKSDNDKNSIDLRPCLTISKLNFREPKHQGSNYQISNSILEELYLKHNWTCFHKQTKYQVFCFGNEKGISMEIILKHCKQLLFVRLRRCDACLMSDLL